MEDEILKAVKEFASSLNTQRKVVADMSALVKATSKLPLGNSNYWERLIRSEFAHALETSASPSWKLWSKPYKLMTWLDLISWDGYKREKSLRTLSGAAPNAFFFSLAIRRLNDWVPQVREAAREKLPEVALETNTEHVVEALCDAIANWNSWGRAESVDKAVILQILCRDEIAEAMRYKLVSSTSGPMSFLFSQLGRTSILDDYLAEISRYAIQPAVRAKAYRSLFEGRIFWVEGRQ